MKITKIINGLSMELGRDDFIDSVFIDLNGKLYDFKLDIDVNGYPLFIATEEVTEKSDSTGIETR